MPMSRRALLGSAIASAVGARVATPSTVRAASVLDTRVPFYGRHQTGILEPVQRHVIFASLDVTVRDPLALGRLLEALTQAAAALQAGRHAPRPVTRASGAPTDSAEALGLEVARLTITFGYGPSLFDDRFGLASQRPRLLEPLPAFAGDALDPSQSGGDLLLQIAGDDAQVVSHAFRQLRGRVVGQAVLRWTQHGFTSTPPDGAPRNLLGFHDGTANPVAGSRELARSVWVQPSDGPAWHADGTYLVFRKIKLLLPSWDRATARAQDETIGRRRNDGIELAPMPFDAHVRRARGSRMLRRSFNYDYGLGPLLGEATPHGDAGAPPHAENHDRFDAGLLFCCFVRNPQTQFVAVQQRLSEGDRLNAFLQPGAAALFAVPPGAAAGQSIAAPLLR